GRLVRVILVTVVCDKPAAHKIGGFASHSHTYFCTVCWISIPDKNTPEAFVQGAFRPRTNEEHRELDERYRDIPTPTARKNFVKEFATWYTQLSRLPYFDIVKQIVIDPMHNLFLGIIETHFHNIWVQNKILRPNHELARLHEMLADFVVPISCGKLPTDIETPAGGSLTADQWLLLSTLYGPIVIPQLWDDCLPRDMSDEVLRQRVTMIQHIENEKEQNAAMKAHNKLALQAAKKVSKEAYEAEKARIANEKLAIAEAKKKAQLEATIARQAEKRRKQAAKKAQNVRVPVDAGPSDGPSLEPQEPQAIEDEGKFALHPDNPANFLKICSALRILIQRRLTDHDVKNAKHLIEEYNKELIQLYGSCVVKPNHHYSIHVGSCVRNFGPLHDFWTFLFERLNKVLKLFKTNNHGSSELETTFFTEFQRTCEIGHLVSTMFQFSSTSLANKAANSILKASKDERGTVAGLAAMSQALNDLHNDAICSYQLSPRHHTKALPSDSYRFLVQTLCFRFPKTPVHCRHQIPLVPNSTPLSYNATFFNYVIVNGKHYYASHTIGSNRSSLVHVIIPGTPPTHVFGEVLEIFQIDQPLDNNQARSLWFAHTRWFMSWRGDLDSVWADL
ncbi:hypothetical protein L210DRAFT_3415850, partial [Boletus edulis BED1]